MSAGKQSINEKPSLANTMGHISSGKGEILSKSFYNEEKAATRKNEMIATGLDPNEQRVHTASSPYK